jgi:hypothetical protein
MKPFVVALLMLALVRVIVILAAMLRLSLIYILLLSTKI